MVFSRSVPLVFAVACMVVSVALSDMASSRTWLAGGHATPEQLALHRLYESLGVHDHHGHPHLSDTEDALSPRAEASVAPVTTPIVAVTMPLSPVEFGHTAQTRPDATVMAIGPSAVHSRRLQLVDLEPAQPDHARHDPPPRRIA